MTGDKNRRGAREIHREAEERMADHFRSPLVNYLRENGFRISSGDTTIVLASQFGFCYGVDRAVEYAFAARQRFRDRRLWITGEIIHNPRVNYRLKEMGIRFLPPRGARLEDRFGVLHKEDVVLIPAFGANADEMAYLLDKGFELVDTTCGSVLNVWKRVRQYARDGFTSIIHGKHDHEETAATCSQVLAANRDGKYLVLRDLDEAALLAEMIEKEDFSRFHSRFARLTSGAFDPRRDLSRIGLANQTTMLESESRRIQEILGETMTKRYGASGLADHFRAFDTICSATEDRQRAVMEMIESGVDRVVVIGGFNSSNTGHLVEIAGRTCPAYHIESVECILDGDRIRAKPLGQEPRVLHGWLPKKSQVIGVTGGASTPDSVVGHVIERIMGIRGMVI
jgi:4-hydroxy-3-methylbut-2-enyl diphosphate reductase